MAPRKTTKTKLSSGPKGPRVKKLPKNDDDNYIRQMGKIQTDSYSNPAARLGSGTPNLAQSGNYPLIRLTEDYPLILSLYRSSWVIRKVIDQIAEESSNKKKPERN